MNRVQVIFASLILAQAFHSVEEYVGRLWESFPPAAFVSGLISADRHVGFVVFNVALVAFGAWCVLGPVRLGRPSAESLMWTWIAIETINGVGHPAWSLVRGGYTPGLYTAPLLLALAIYLGRQLRASPR
jgi:hypothetical protein